MSGTFGLERETDERPWGHYVVLDDAEDHKVKRIVVRSGKRLSLQVHQFRAEHWFVVAGTGVATVGADMVAVGAGDSLDIPVRTAHRIENAGDEDLVFIEVQTGESFGEDDIVRLDDDFGRS